ncbi:pentapeptide repeat-containing protein [Microcoleus sp. FACHB-68]|uniref:pentapeptide repeat-containing protein n=1 Tax=Microcoleus sp. FACHB-68 TaxID=2692826 RepID=UPI0016885CD9|nr:pentapeptide repeat-containing protein [Microcoleus sp. FACHB-68]MBD1940030.1 pentapeptide repeat-containing protein [Microcoleus sp. FACHB-68]
MASNLQPKELRKSLEKWTQAENEGKEFNLTDEQLHWEIYDLLGVEGLTPEIVKDMRVWLDASDESRPVQLFNRLNNFYLRWCDGEFIDAPAENLPQKKMRLLKEQVQPQQLGQRQVDIYAGLNVMILLLELNRYALSKARLKDEIAFYPCGKKDTEGFDNQRLLRIISYSNCFSVGVFNTIVGKFLSKANLIGADLHSTDLSEANLRDANLIRANLSEANLIGADLYSADLMGANFSRANFSRANFSCPNLSRVNLSRANLYFADLSGANLSEANLIGVNLIYANLSGANFSRANLNRAQLIRAKLYHNANLSGANLSGANLRSAQLIAANLENISWNEDTKWDDVQWLETAKNTPAALKQQLGLE